MKLSANIYQRLLWITASASLLGIVGCSNLPRTASSNNTAMYGTKGRSLHSITGVSPTAYDPDPYNPDQFPSGGGAGADGAPFGGAPAASSISTASSGPSSGGHSSTA